MTVAVAVVGTGAAGRRHLANLLRLGEDVIGVSEHAARTSVQTDGGTVECVHTVREALDRGVHAAVIANPTSMHVATADEFVDAGVHLYIEKPVAVTAPECAALAKRAAEAGVVVAVGHHLRFHPLVETFGTWLTEGRCGRVLAVDANWGEHLADYHPDEDYRHSYAARRELGGGVLLTQIHLPDLLNAWFGPFTNVFAVGGHRSDLELDVEDCVSFLATTTDGAPVYGHLDYLQRPKRSTISVTGTAAQVRLDLNENLLVLEPSSATDESIRVQRPVVRNDLFLAAMEDFLDACDRDSSPRCSLPQAADVLALVDAIRDSMTTGVTNKPSLRA